MKQFEEEEEQFDMLTIHEAYQWLSRKYIDDDLAKNTGMYLFGLNPKLGGNQVNPRQVDV